MANSLRDFLVGATQKAAADLETALLRIPEDKRGWSPMDKGRTALDQVAECALINGGAIDLIQKGAWPGDFDFAAFERAKAEVMSDWNALKAALEQNTAKLIEAIRAAPEEDLGREIQMPWGPMTLAQLIAYPYWNMSYHEGQINYIASMLGCLQ